MQARPHVRVLGVGDDEIRGPIGAAQDARELVVESEHERLSPVWPSVYRPPSRHGTRLKRARWRSAPVVASFPPPAGSAVVGGASMAKSLRKARNARTGRGWLIAAAGFAPALACVAPARAADDDPYAKPEA